MTATSSIRFQQVGAPDQYIDKINQIVDLRVPEEPPACELHGWAMLPNNRIYAEYMKNHPRLGSGKDAMTGTIVYFSREMKVAASRRTTYILFDEKPSK